MSLNALPIKCAICNVPLYIVKPRLSCPKCGRGGEQREVLKEVNAYIAYATALTDVGSAQFHAKKDGQDFRFKVDIPVETR